MTRLTNTQPSDDERPDGPDTRAWKAQSETLPLFNREFSQIEFYRRVLEEALDPTPPLLERLKFLSIFSENLDEFFMIRVSGLQETLAGQVEKLSPDGLAQLEQLKEIRARLLPLFEEQTRCLREEILPGLAEQGIRVVQYNTLSLPERQQLREFYKRQVHPVLTPQAVDQGHPFPYISNQSLNLALMVEPMPEHGITRSLTGKVEPRFARIKLPPLVPRLVPVDESGSKFVFLEDLITANLESLFPRMRVSHCHAFRVTRDADVDVREEEANDLLSMMEKTLSKRRFGSAVRLEVDARMPAGLRDKIVEELELSPDDVYEIDGPLNVRDLMQLYKLDRPELKDAPFKQRFSKALAGADDYFARIREATALVELKARFDEENNIEWAKRLEESGVHVVYGLIGLKTHCKVALVVRREGEALRRYVHLATGNYNPVTSNFYTDLGLLTADEEVGADATDLFNFLTGFSRQKEYKKLLVSPAVLRDKTIGLIRREAEHARAGRPARIIVKINRLADTRVIAALYEASQAGVPIDLIVRGICMLKPGVEGLSETINVRSIVGRFLEHSRAYYFRNGGEEEVYTGSADWMPRNFDRRVETIAPVRDERLKRYLKDVLLDAYLRDNVKARVLDPDGRYRPVPPEEGAERFNCQLFFIDAPAPE
jgi:polyphosphate kinase